MTGESVHGLFANMPSYKILNTHGVWYLELDPRAMEGWQHVKQVAGDEDLSSTLLPPPIHIKMLYGVVEAGASSGLNDQLVYSYLLASGQRKTLFQSR